MTRRALLAMLACLPIGWRVTRGAHSEAYLPFEQLKMANSGEVFEYVGEAPVYLMYAWVGHERLNGDQGLQKFFFSTANPYWQVRAGWHDWHRPGWLRVRTKFAPDDEWIPIRKVWARPL